MANILRLLKTGPGFSKLIDEDPGLRRFLQRRFPDQGVEVAPNIYSDTREFRDFVHREIELLTKSGNFVPKFDDAGNVTNAIDDSYLKIKTIPGYHSHPRPVGIDSNVGEREKRKLSQNWLSEDAKRIYKELFVYLVLRRVDASLPVNAKSTSAMPLWTYDPAEKLGGMERVLKYIEKNKDRRPTISELAAHQIYCFAVVGYRSQVDSIDKKRQVSVGNGRVVEADKTTEFADMYRTRERAVYAFSSDINLCFQSLWCGIQKHAFTAYDKTFKVRFPEDVGDRMNRFKSHTTVDVAGFDTTVPSFILEYFLELLEEYQILNTCAIQILRYMLGAPSISPCPFLKEEEWYPTGDYLNEDDYHLNRGLLSGVFCVSFLGRWIMAGEMLFKLHQVNNNVIGNVEKYLLHQMPDAAFINASDDNFCGASSQKLLDDWIAAPGHFMVEKEDHRIFLGYFYNYEGGLLKPYPNLSNLMFVNRDCPERSIGLDADDQRAGWYTGWKMVKELGLSHPLYHEAYHIKEQACLDVYGRTYEAQMNMKQEPLRLFGALTTEEKWFLTNPDAIHYKVDAENISPELLALRFKAQSPKETNNWAAIMAGPGVIWMDK